MKSKKDRENVTQAQKTELIKLAIGSQKWYLKCRALQTLTLLKVAISTSNVSDHFLPKIKEYPIKYYEFRTLHNFTDII